MFACFANKVYSKWTFTLPPWLITYSIVLWPHGILIQWFLFCNFYFVSIFIFIFCLEFSLVSVYLFFKNLYQFSFSSSSWTKMFFSQLVLVFSLVPVNYSERVKISTQLFVFYYSLLYLSALCLCCLSFLFFSPVSVFLFMARRLTSFLL